MEKIRKFSKFSFYYLMPFSLGIITGLFVKDSIILGNKRKLTMAVFEYFNNQEETIPVDFYQILPELKSIEKRFLKIKKDKENKIE